MGPGSDCKVYGMLQRELVLITLVIGNSPQQMYIQEIIRYIIQFWEIFIPENLYV